jgi:hypothetical protein
VLGVKARPASLGSAGTPQGRDALSHFESYADAAVKSNTCALPNWVGFQTSRQRSTIEIMNLEQRQKEARRKEKSAAKRARREARRQQKAGASPGAVAK